MAAIGTQAKKDITNKILEVFEGSFLYNDGKEIRIPVYEDGTLRQIKVTLTCAKTNVEGGNGGSVAASVGTTSTQTGAPANFMNEPTAEEKAAVADLCAKLGLTD